MFDKSKKAKVHHGATTTRSLLEEPNGQVGAALSLNCNKNRRQLPPRHRRRRRGRAFPTTLSSIIFPRKVTATIVA